MLSMALLMLPIIPATVLLLLWKILLKIRVILTRTVGLEALVMLAVEEASLTLTVVTLTSGPLQVTVAVTHWNSINFKSLQCLV